MVITVCTVELQQLEPLIIRNPAKLKGFYLPPGSFLYSLTLDSRTFSFAPDNYVNFI